MKKIFLLFAFMVHLVMHMHAAGGSVCCPSETEKIVKPVYQAVR